LSCNAIPYIGGSLINCISGKLVAGVALILVMAVPVTYAQSISMEQADFTDYVAQAVRREVGDMPVLVKGTLTLSLGSFQLNLDRIYGICQRNEAICASEVDRYVKGVSQVVKAANAPIDKESVRIVIRSDEYIKRAQASLGSSGPVLQFRSLADGLVSVAVLDTPRAIRPLDDRDLKKLEISQEQLFEIGRKNLQRTLKPLAENAKPVSGGQIGTLGGSAFEVGRVAVPTDWSALAAAQNGILLVALPATDTLLYISESSDSAIDALRSLAVNIARKSPNPLSLAVLRWTKERWELVP